MAVHAAVAVARLELRSIELDACDIDASSITFLDLDLMYPYIRACENATGRARGR